MYTTMYPFKCLLFFSVHSFGELVKFVFTIPGVSVFLSNRICQDPLEKFFGQQHQRGRVNETPSVGEFLHNTQALRVIQNMCRSFRGNCREGIDLRTTEMSDEPLPKCPRKSKEN